MFATIVGAIVILLGLGCFLKPEKLKQSMGKKVRKTMRRYVFALALAMGSLLISAGWAHEGLFAKVVVILGVIAIVKAALFLRSSASDAIAEWALKQPLWVFRVMACGNIALGLAMIFGLRS